MSHGFLLPWKRLAFVGALAGTFITSTAAHAADDWDSRYRDAVKSCILRSQKNAACVHTKDGNPLDISSQAYEAFYDSSYTAMYGAVGVVARGISMARVAVDPENAPYWKRYNSELNYRTLKKYAGIRAKKDQLEPCQKACLATCISSKIMEYDDRNLPTHWREGIGREKGVCREFSAMAVDLMKSLGLQAETITGVAYEINQGLRPKRIGGHVMVKVNLPQGPFIMEPQSASCEFFDRSFSKVARKFEAELLNTREL